MGVFCNKRFASADRYFAGLSVGVEYPAYFKGYAVFGERDNIQPGAVHVETGVLEKDDSILIQCHPHLSYGKEEAPGFIVIEAAVALLYQKNRSFHGRVQTEAVFDQAVIVPLSAKAHAVFEGIYPRAMLALIPGEPAFEAVSVCKFQNAITDGLTLLEFALEAVFTGGEIAVITIPHHDSVPMALSFLESACIGFGNGGKMDTGFIAVCGFSFPVLHVIEPLSLIIVAVAGTSAGGEFVVVALPASLPVLPHSVVAGVVSVQFIVHVAASVWLSVPVDITEIAVSVFERYLFGLFHPLFTVIGVQLGTALVAFVHSLFPVVQRSVYVWVAVGGIISIIKELPEICVRGSVPKVNRFHEFKGCHNPVVRFHQDDAFVPVSYFFRCHFSIVCFQLPKYEKKRIFAKMDTMKTWNALIIDVDYSPSDPGIRRCFCERTQYSKKDLTPGKLLSYEDPGGLFGSIVLKECDDDKVVLTYGGRDFVLREGSSWACLGKDGRNYTNFELNVSLQLEYLIVNTPKFFRQFGTREQLAALSENDIRHFESSDDPCAKFVLGRWHYLLMPREDSAVLAEKYIREAVEGGVADAYETLSYMFTVGDTAEDTVDLEKAARLRDEAISRGSEAARMRFARNRIAGILLAPEEPAKVAREIEKILSEEEDPNPGWYSVLAYAYEVLGKAEEAKKTYEEGIAHGSKRCYSELACWYRERGMEEEYDKTMEAGIKAGFGFCYTFHADLDEEEYEKKTPELQRYFTRFIRDRLLQGLKRGDGACAYYLGLNYFYGYLGFEDEERTEAGKYLERGMQLGDSCCYSLVADILEMGTPSDEDRRDAAHFRLKALRLGNDTVLSKVIIAYRRGLLDKYQDEIEKYWLPEDYDDYEEDDGRFDAYV